MSGAVKDEAPRLLILYASQTGECDLRSIADSKILIAFGVSILAEIQVRPKISPKGSVEGQSDGASARVLR